MKLFIYSYDKALLDFLNNNINAQIIFSKDMKDWDCSFDAVIIDERAPSFDYALFFNSLNKEIIKVFIGKGIIGCLDFYQIRNLRNLKQLLEIFYLYNKKATTLIGKSKNIILAKEKAQKVKKGHCIHIYGESGTGKSIIASLINKNRNPKKMMQRLNCSELNSNLNESLIFGHEAGAYTDAKKARMGILSLADETDLFLDEIAKISKNAQNLFLTVLDDGYFRNIGGSLLTSNFDLITASNVDLKLLKKKLSKEFYYRIFEDVIIIDPLRKRQEDIIELCHYFMKIYQKKELSLSLKDFLISYSWPGNVRELFSTLKNAIFCNTKDMITLDYFLKVNEHILEYELREEPKSYQLNFEFKASL